MPDGLPERANDVRRASVDRARCIRPRRKKFSVLFLPVESSSTVGFPPSLRSSAAPGSNSRIHFSPRGRLQRQYFMSKPDFFIVGAPKCGTTAMAQYIAGHPDVFMARKEMHV